MPHTHSLNGSKNTPWLFRQSETASGARLWGKYLESNEEELITARKPS
jgi:hypothetical protein